VLFHALEKARGHAAAICPVNSVWNRPRSAVFGLYLAWPSLTGGGFPLLHRAPPALFRPSLWKFIERTRMPISSPRKCLTSVSFPLPFQLLLMFGLSAPCALLELRPLLSGLRSRDQRRGDRTRVVTSRCVRSAHQVSLNSSSLVCLTFAVRCLVARRRLAVLWKRTRPAAGGTRPLMASDL